MLKKFVPFSIFFLLILFQTFSLRADEKKITPELKRSFEMALFQALSRLEDVRQKRTYHMRSVNDSIAKTTEAVNFLKESNNYPAAEKLLIEANKIHPDNALAELVLADVLDAQGKMAEAAEAYTQFLKKASRASSLSRAVMTYEDRVIFSEFVRIRLFQKGVTPPDPKGDETLPLLNQLAWEKDSPLRVFVASGLPVFVMIGFPIILIRRFSSASPLKPWHLDALLIRIYLWFVFGYGIWLGHLFLEWKAIINPPEREVFLLLFAGIIFSFAKHAAILYAKEKQKEKDETLMRCTKCKKLIPKLSAFCPYCRKEY